MSSDFVFISSSLAILRARFVLRILLFCSTLIFSRSASLKFNSLISFQLHLRWLPGPPFPVVVFLIP
uniref:Uncharacterized protein n=1 Tax=Populus trichocarpa TaxID=3694 RepID=A0A2K1R796_POPTR